MYDITEGGLYRVIPVSGVDKDGRKREGIALIYDEKEVDRRLKILEKLAKDNPDYESVIEEIKNYHALRRAKKFDLEVVD